MSKKLRALKKKKKAVNSNTKWHSQREIIKALEQAYGMKTYAAKLLDMTYQGLWKRLKESEELQKAMQRIEERALDESELALLKNIRAGKEASIFFHLKCKGKSRGYSEKPDINLNVQGGSGMSVDVFKQEFNLKIEEVKKLGTEKLLQLNRILSGDN